MDPRLLRHYNRELQHVREMGGEFAREFPKIAARLGLEGFECADPYVERLLEGFAFLTARIQLKLDAQFPDFTQHLLEMTYPHYLAPTPSMAVVQLQPDAAQGSLGSGFVVPRDTALRSLLGKGDQTPCEYRTAHEVTLWPLEVVAVEYRSHPRGLPGSGAPWLATAKGTLRLRLQTKGGARFSELPIDRLPIFLRGTGDTPLRLYEQLHGNALGLTVTAAAPGATPTFLDRSKIGRVGFADNEALLRYGPRSFQGYRLLQEYFAFPDRYLFAELGGLAPALRRCSTEAVDITVALSRVDPILENALDPSQFALFCTPAINLFPKRADRIHLSDQQSEFHVVPDRTRPLDFEVHSVSEVTGYGAAADSEQRFLPFYGFNDLSGRSEQASYYLLTRKPRLLSAQQRRTGPRSSYVGSEVYVSLVDAHEAPYSSNLRQLGVTTYCTNRDLPLQMPLGQKNTDFTLESGAPVQAARCVAGPTKPQPSAAEGETAWRLISHLSLNYLSLTDSDEEHGAAAFRELLSLYSGSGDATLRKQIEGLRSIRTRPINRRIPTPGPVTFGRGIEVTVNFDESAFGGAGVFLLGAVLEHFFARYVSLNSFTETVVTTAERGEVSRWPARSGRRPLV
ncbi:MAG: type VI secretion system baseplate subunit TssF [Deltaproteobacteria bacterium]|nr:type VI secretion system baseplate subunit TssF [Deltaproteobacteria bacterium]